MSGRIVIVAVELESKSEHANVLMSVAQDGVKRMNENWRYATHRNACQLMSPLESTRNGLNGVSVQAWIFLE